MSHNEAASEQRLTPRENDHLHGYNVKIVIGEAEYDGKLTDESVTGVGVELAETVEVAADSLVIVSNGRNYRDAIVQRAWFGEHGETRLGLKWRAAQFR